MIEKDFEPTIQEKIEFNKLQLKGVYKNIYDAMILKRVALKCEDKELEKRGVDNLIKMEKMKDEFLLIIDELEKEKTAKETKKKQ